MEMENVYILVYCINSDDIAEYNKIYKAIEDNLKTYSSLMNNVKETSTIYYQATTKQNLEFIKIMELYLRKDDSLTIINLTSKEQVIFWDNDRFKQSKKYSYLLHH